MTRMVSPFDPGSKAVVEVIRQPLYDEQLWEATTTSLPFFQTGFAARDYRQTNLEQAGVLPVPKFFVMDALRVIFTENKAHIEKIVDLEDLMYGTFTKFVLGGLKDYLVLPTFLIPAGVGIVGMDSQGGLTTGQQTIASPGVPSLSNRYILRQHVITIPPQQSFKVEMVAPAALSGIVDTETWVVLEGDMAREVL